MAKTELLTDNFTAANSTNWSGYGSNPTVTSGRLSIVPTGSYPTLYSAVRYDLTSSFILAQLVQAGNVGNGSVSAILSAEVSAGNSEQILVEGNNLIFRESVSTVNNDTSITYNPTTHAWLRIRESAGTIYWDTSPDSITWTNRRSKSTGIGSVASVQINFIAGFWGTEPTPGTVLFDNFNLPLAPPPTAPGWVVGSRSLVGGPDGGTINARSYFDTADWLWAPIVNNPVIDADSAAIVSSLASTANGAIRCANMYDYGVTLVDPATITAATPRYTVPLANDPAWGTSQFSGSTIPIPNGTGIPPGTDGHVSVADPITNSVYSMWQAVHSNGTWSASWGAKVDLHGDGRESAPGSSTASGLSAFAATIRGSEIAAGQIPHALFFSTDMAHTSAFRYPARKTDGDNLAGVPVPIPEGARVQLDPTIDVNAIPNITAAEIAIARALQTYGAYCGDKSGARMSFAFEYVNDGTNPGQVYVDAGMPWDYFDLSHIPWGSLRVLNSWNGS